MLMTPSGTRNFGLEDVERISVVGYDLGYFNQRLLEMSRSHFTDYPIAPAAQQRDRIAGAALEQSTRVVLSALDDETSVRWSDLANRTELSWPEICKAVGLLTWAGLCSPGPSRFRLTEMGVSILGGSSGPRTTWSGIEQA